jgi:hypothetical protein
MMIGPKFLFKVTLVLISLLIIDGGKTSLWAGSNIISITNSKSIDDIESTDHYNYDIADDFEKWIVTDYQESSVSILITPGITCFYTQKIKDFTNSIWQPPKSC